MAPPYNREGSPEKLDSEQQLEKRAAENAGPEAATAPAVAEVFNAKGGVKQKFDLAVEALKGQDLHYSKEEERAVVRKIDWRLMPICAWACGLQFVDKSALGAAATYGMREDIGLVGQEYSWCVTMFYFGYLIGTPVMARLMQRYHAGKTIGLAYFAWGVTLLGMLGVDNFGGIMALRFLLGLFEAALVPGLLLITTMWYNKVEMPFRFGLWTITNGILPVPALIIYWARARGNGKTRLIFLFLGILSVLTGVLLVWALPDNPTTVKWLNTREKAVAVKRLEESQSGVKNTTFKWEQAREAARDPLCWVMVLQMFFSQAAGSVTTNFLGIVIKGFGYTALKAQLYTAPNYAVQALTQVIVSAPPTFIPWFYNKKQPLVGGMSMIAVAGIAILYASEPVLATQNRRLAGCILISTSGANYTQIMAVIGCNVAGFTKKQVVTSAAFVLYCIINVITPQVFMGREAPTYHTGLGFVLGFLSTFIVLCFLGFILMNAENRRRDKLARTDPDNYGTGDDNTEELSGLKDNTDRVNGHFRYSS